MHNDSNISTAHSHGGTEPDQGLARHAVEATRLHPLFQEANGFHYCEPIVMFEPGNYFERTRFPELVKEQIRAAVSGLERVLIVSYWTSASDPQPLSGGGKTFDFVLHPTSLEILHSRVGSWRS